MTTVPIRETAALPTQHVPNKQGLPNAGDRLEREGDWVEVFSRAKLPTRFGDFDILVFRNSRDAHEHVAVVNGEDLRGLPDVLTRVHSECLTGDVLASLRCDCRQQLEAALQAIGKTEHGVLLYMRQEGRGIGLGEKIRAYSLQEQGLDTYEANRHLGFDDDLRDYTVAGLILQMLGLESIRLATNNPAKMFGLRSGNVTISDRVPLVVDDNPHNQGYLDTKARSGHLLSR